MLKEYSVKLFKVAGREFDYANISKAQLKTIDKRSSESFIAEMISMTMRDSDVFINAKYKEILEGRDVFVS
jgi:hypothetical protein